MGYKSSYQRVEAHTLPISLKLFYYIFHLHTLTTGQHRSAWVKWGQHSAVRESKQRLMRYKDNSLSMSVFNYDKLENYLAVTFFSQNNVPLLKSKVLGQVHSLQGQFFLKKTTPS